jgi:hypothetical protein
MIPSPFCESFAGLFHQAKLRRLSMARMNALAAVPAGGFFRWIRVVLVHELDSAK